MSEATPKKTGQWKSWVSSAAVVSVGTLCWQLYEAGERQGAKNAKAELAAGASEVANTLAISNEKLKICSTRLDEWKGAHQSLVVENTKLVAELGRQNTNVYLQRQIDSTVSDINLLRSRSAPSDAEAISRLEERVRVLIGKLQCNV